MVIIKTALPVPSYIKVYDMDGNYLGEWSKMVTTNIKYEKEQAQDA